MRISIIVAQSTQHVIGNKNQLPWHLPNDLKHFKRTTLGHHVIMGRKTFASLPQPLVGRTLLILSKNPHYAAPGAYIFHHLPAALAWAEQAGETEVFIAGGSSIYQAALPFADTIYRTEVKAHVAGDAFFPVVDEGQWREVDRIMHPQDRHHPYPYDFVELQRVT